MALRWVSTSCVTPPVGLRTRCCRLEPRLGCGSLRLVVDRKNSPCCVVRLHDLDFLGIVTTGNPRAAERSDRLAACVNPEQQEAHL